MNDIIFTSALPTYLRVAIILLFPCIDIGIWTGAEAFKTDARGAYEQDRAGHESHPGLVPEPAFQGEERCNGT